MVLEPSPELYCHHIHKSLSICFLGISENLILSVHKFSNLSFFSVLIIKKFSLFRYVSSHHRALSRNCGSFILKEREKIVSF